VQSNQRCLLSAELQPLHVNHSNNVSTEQRTTQSVKECQQYTGILLQLAMIFHDKCQKTQAEVKILQTQGSPNSNHKELLINL